MQTFSKEFSEFLIKQLADGEYAFICKVTVSTSLKGRTIAYTQTQVIAPSEEMPIMQELDLQQSEGEKLLAERLEYLNFTKNEVKNDKPN